MTQKMSKSVESLVKYVKLVYSFRDFFLKQCCRVVQNALGIHTNLKRKKNKLPQDFCKYNCAL